MKNTNTDIPNERKGTKKARTNGTLKGTPADRKKPTLRHRQEHQIDTFAQHYAETGNATQAALTAFPHLSYRAAVSTGFKLKDTADVQERLITFRKQVQEQLRERAAAYLSEMERIALKGTYDRDRLKAIEGLLDRAGLTVERESTVKHVNGAPDEMLERAKKLASDKAKVIDIEAVPSDDLPKRQ